MIDLSKLAGLLGHDDSRIARFLDIYKIEVPALLYVLSSNIAKSDWEQAAIAAHGIKSQSAYLGANEVVKLAKEIESEADRQNDRENIKKMYLALKEEIQNALDEIDKIRTQ